MAHPLNILTGRYADKTIAGSGLVPIGVTRYAPRWPLPYRLKINILLLAPSPGLLARARTGKVTPKQFGVEHQQVPQALRKSSSIFLRRAFAEGAALLHLERHYDIVRLV